MIRLPRPGFISDALHTDEIGIATGIYGDYRLRTAYQPIFSPRDNGLVPVAVEGLVAPLHRDRPVGARAFVRRVPAEHVHFVQSVCEVLHLRNHCSIGVERLELLLPWHPPQGTHSAGSDDDFAFMAQRHGDMEFDPKLLTYEITEAAELEAGVLARVAAAMRSFGIRIAVGDFGVRNSTLDRAALLRPDVIRLHGAWFRKLAADRSAAHLLPSLLRGLRADGAKVLVPGIEGPRQLDVALEAGADLLQGNLLGAPALAGTIFDNQPRPLGPLLAHERKIIPLFA